jgi:prepilin-type N-terminal cleavage/methylation domain-containing protein
MQMGVTIMPSHFRQSKRGFTLIEMLVVIAVIGILVGLLLPILAKVKINGKETATRSFMSAIQTAAGLYEFDWGQYPNDGLNPSPPSPAVALLARKPGNAAAPGTYRILGSKALYYFLCTPFKSVPAAVTVGRGEVWATKDMGIYLDCPVARTKKATPTADATEIVDIWNNPYQYDSLRDDSYLVSGVPYNDVSANGTGWLEIRNSTYLKTGANAGQQNPLTFDIWSHGDSFDPAVPTSCTRPLANFKCKWE